MAESPRRSLFPIGCLAVCVVAVAVLICAVTCMQQTLDNFEEGMRGGPLELDAPILEGRALPDEPAHRGEAKPRQGEVWFEELTLEELIDSEEPEIIVGRVLDTEGKPLEGVEVMAALDDDLPPDEEWESGGSSTDEEGLFLLSDLPDRVFRLTAERDHRRAVIDDDPTFGGIERVVVSGVRAGRLDVRIRMPAMPDPDKEWEVRVRVLGPDGKDVPAWGYSECIDGVAVSSIDGKVEPDPGQPGIVRFHGPPPYGLLVESPTNADWEDLPFAPGYVFPVVPRKEPYVVRLQRAGTVRGRVRFEGHDKYANLVVRYLVTTSGRAEDPERVPQSDDAAAALRWDMTGTSEDGSFDLDGLPPGRVRLIPLRRGAELESASNADGITATVGDRDVRVHLPVHAPIKARLDFGALKDLEDTALQAHVTRLEYGHPRLVWSQELDVAALRAAEGRFETPPLDASLEYTLTVQAQRTALLGPAPHPLAMRRIERVKPGGEEVFILLAALPAIGGSIKTADDRSVGAGVDVLAMRVDAHPLRLAALLEDWEQGGFTPPEPPVLPPLGAGPYHATTDAKGAFLFPGLLPGRYVVWTDGPEGLAMQRDPPVRSGDSNVRLVVRPLTRITGRVRAPAGALPHGFLVEARGPQGASSSVVRSDGYFELRGLSEGDYRIYAYNAGDASDNRMAVCTSVRTGTRRLDLPLGEGVRIEGHVIDERGGRTRGARVTFRLGGDQRSTVVGRDGAYGLAGLPAGQGILHVRLPDGREETVALAGGSGGTRIVVP